MPKSKNKNDHKKRLAAYKSNKKKEQESFKKKLMENYMKMQQDSLAETEAHTSTEEVVGPEINLDELNNVDSSFDIDPIIDIESLDIDPINTIDDVTIAIDVDPIDVIDVESMDIHSQEL